MPVLRGAHGGLQDPPPHFLGNVGVPVELAERLLERVERAFRDREVVGILEALGVCMLEDRSQGDHRPAAHLFGPVAAAQDGEQRLTPYPFAERSLARRTPWDPKTLGRRTAFPLTWCAGILSGRCPDAERLAQVEPKGVEPSTSSVRF